MNHELLELPWKAQLVLASGYAGYLLAYVGIRGHHRPVDIGAISLIFSLVASFALFLLGRAAALLVGAPLADEYGAVAVGPGVVVVTLLCAALWRRRLRDRWMSVLRRHRITWSDDDPSALHTLASDTENYVTQVGVRLDDGTWLHCDDTGRFRDAPFGPFLLGPNGDLALYLTSSLNQDGTSKVMKSTIDEDHGDRITYVPAARIRQINMRHRRRD